MRISVTVIKLYTRSIPFRIDILHTNLSICPHFSRINIVKLHTEIWNFIRHRWHVSGPINLSLLCDWETLYCQHLRVVCNQVITLWEIIDMPFRPSFTWNEGKKISVIRISDVFFCCCYFFCDWYWLLRQKITINFNVLTKKRDNKRKKLTWEAHLRCGSNGQFCMWFYDTQDVPYTQNTNGQ